MRKYNTYSVLFYIRNEKVNKAEKVPIYMRITINGKRVEISTKQWIEAARWNSSGVVKGNKPDADHINRVLEYFRNRAWNTYTQLEEKYEYLTAEMLKDHFFKHLVDRKTLIGVFKSHNERVKELIGKDYAPATYKRYETTFKHIQEFVINKYKKEDLELIELKYSFIEDFEHFLKTTKVCNHNTTLKYIKIFRKVINSAVKNDWIIKDPFAKYKSSFDEVKRGFLTEDEIKLLLNKQFSINRLELVRDIFVFACFTGLTYADTQKITWDNIVEDNNKKLCISIHRTKTDTECFVPLLSVPLRIIEKYKDYPEELKKGKLLPTLSNQKMNAYLKEIAALCGVKKNISFHLARHTCATLLLNNGVPIETVAKILGHKNIRTTQIYAKMQKEKVSSDINKIEDVLNEKLQSF